MREAERREGGSNTVYLSSFIRKNGLIEKVTSAEVYITSFIVEHNLPFHVCRHTGRLFIFMFYSCVIQ